MRRISHHLIFDMKQVLDDYTILIEKYIKKDPGFYSGSEMWLEKAGLVLKKFNLIEHSSFAKLRGQIKIIRKKPGLSNLDNKEVPYARKSEKTLQCFHLINQGQDLIKKVFFSENEKTEKAEGIISQILILALQKGIIDLHALKERTPDMVESAWQKISLEEGFLSAIYQVKNLISRVDIVILLDKLIDNFLE